MALKINLDEVDLTQFMVHPHIVGDLGGETLWLVIPQFAGAKWDQKNKIFRSSVWNDQGEPVSLGFPKFTNWGESPEHFPVPKSLEGCTITEKLDGSLLIMSKYKNKIILRTRGTVDAHGLDNGHELKIFEEKILPKFDGLLGTKKQRDLWDFSILFEWVSPLQRVILSYGDEPDWYLVGWVYHGDYSLESQFQLNQTAKALELKRPPAYQFPSVEELIKDVESWKGREGVVIYSKNDQVLHKVKGAWYLALHHMKEALASIDKIIDVWFEQGHPSYQKFEEFVTTQFDYELWSQIRGEVSRICDAWKEVENICSGMDEFVRLTLRPMPTRKDQALKTIASYGQTNRASFVFKMLDNRPLDTDDLKKLLYQALKK